MVAERKIRVAVFVDNNCLRDNRVIRSSEAIAEAGYEVRVFCRNTRQGIVGADKANGVSYERNWIPTLYYAQNIRAHLESLMIYLVKIPGGWWGKFNFLVTSGLLMGVYCLKWVTDWFRSARNQRSKKLNKALRKRQNKRHKVLLKERRRNRFWGLKYLALRVFFFASRHAVIWLRRIFWTVAGGLAFMVAFVPLLIGAFFGALGFLWISGVRYITHLQQPELNVAQKRAQQVRGSALDKHKPKLHRRLLNFILSDKSDETYVSRITKYRAARIYQLTREQVVNFRPDIIHAHDLVNLPVGVLLGRDTNARVIYDAHELETARDKPSHKHWKKEICKLERHFSRQVDKVITVSAGLAEQIGKIHEIEKPTVIFNTPDMSIAQTPSVRIRDELGLDQKTPLGIYVGGLKINRGLPFFLEAAKEIPDLHIAACGPRTEVAEQAFRELVAELGMEDRFHMVGPIAPEYLLGYLDSAEFSIMPTQNIGLSYIQAMPNKFFESMMSNVPIIVGQEIEGMASIVRERQLGVLVQQDDPQSIAEGMRRLLSNSDSLKSHIKSQKLDIEYGWKTQTKRLEALYEQIASSAKNEVEKGMSAQLS